MNSQRWKQQNSRPQMNSQRWKQQNSRPQMNSQQWKHQNSQSQMNSQCWKQQNSQPQINSQRWKQNSQPEMNKVTTETTQQSTTTETTTESGKTSTVALGYCECQCDLPQYSNISMEEILKTLKQITDSLTVNKSELSSTIRQKTCADDDRPSARGVGYIGCGVLTTLLVLILFVDLHTIFTYLRRKS
ncbi:hypothetical protein KUTeg_012067 [Tegillarca granosa]|uniref:Uncharacterized protein n=1 Tax=Tegillarca granosa TaxID=220873 RepID=A0ABQ9F1P5_TEGGR|nr:hypothetical protein KUTeg_012067 [Tegillarca granosa]